MPAQIHDRGRGPEIVGTRVTVYRIMDYLEEGASAERMAKELDLTPDEVQAALVYVQSHRKEVDAGYAAILERIKREAEACAQEQGPLDVEALKARLAYRRILPAA